MCIFFACILFLCTLSAGANGAVTYYAQIKTLTASYDRYTETVDFEIVFEGAVFETHYFTAAVYCTALIDGVWVENYEYEKQSLLYGDCHTKPNSFTGALRVRKADYLGNKYKDFTLFVSGAEVEAGSATSGSYYTLNSAVCAVPLKAEPTGDFFALGAEATPSVCKKGGTVVLTLYPKDINAHLSGGILEFGFTVGYNKSLLTHIKTELSGKNGQLNITKQEYTEKGIKLYIKAENGITEDKEAVVKLYFRTLEAGSTAFTAYDISGKDKAGHEFKNAVYALNAKTWITEGSAFLPGDVNADGTVDSADAALVLRYDAGLISDISHAADVNADGDIDSADAALILRYDAGLINGF